MSTTVEISDLSFTYAGASRPVLQGVSLTIDDGELSVMVGPSGAGKSTLLRCMNGLVPHFHGGAFAGRVMVAGVDTRTRQPRDLARIAGMVFQEPEAQTVANIVEDEIVFGLENMATDRTLTRRRLEEVLDALGIAHLRHRSTATLSGGELQRVALAAVLTMQPRLLLLDEPTSQLDPQAAHDVLSAVRDLSDELGLTVVVSEHRLDRIAPFADRVIQVCGDGHVRTGPARDVIASLASAPPVTLLGAALGWSPIPLSIAEARRFSGARVIERPAPARAPVTPAGDDTVTVRDLDVRLGDRRVLLKVTLTLREGEIVGLMGRNGAGKTTLLRTLAGLIAPERRESLHYRSPNPIEDHYRDCAYVAQDPAAMLYRATVRREIADVAQGTGRQVNIEAVLSEWHLEHLAALNPRDLSVGERQRVALAAMLCGAPRLILLDEPTRGMDAETKELLVANLRRRAAAGATIVVASHDVELAARVATRVVLLAEGELIADGPVREVLSGSITFSTQANKLFGGDVVTVEDALALSGVRS